MSTFNTSSNNPYENEARRLFGFAPGSSYQLGSTRPDLLAFMQSLSAGNRASNVGSTASSGTTPSYQPLVDSKTPTPGTSGGTGTPAKIRRVSPNDVNAANSMSGLIALMGDADMMDNGPYKRSIQSHIMDRMRLLRRDESDARRREDNQRRSQMRMEAAKAREHQQWIRFMEELRPGATSQSDLSMGAFENFMNSPDRHTFQQWKASKDIKASATPQPGTMDPLATAEASNRALASQDQPSEFDLFEARRLGLPEPVVETPIKTPGAQAPQGRDLPRTSTLRPGGLTAEEVESVGGTYDKARLQNAYRGAFNQSIEGQQFSESLDTLNRLMDTTGMRPESKTYLMGEIRAGRISVAEAIRTLQSQRPTSPEAVRSAVNVGRQQQARTIATTRDVSALDAYKDALLRGDITPEEYRQLTAAQGY